MLDKLSSGLRGIFDKISGISIADKEKVEEIIKDIQRTLLQADVDVRLVFELSNKIRASVKSKEMEGLTLREKLIKTLYEEMVKLLGSEPGKLELLPQRIMVIGLFGSGKTTVTGKLALWFKKRGLKPAMVACDTHRPAAKEQLIQIGEKIGVNVYHEGASAIEVARNAINKAKEAVLIFDTAGRDALDEELAKELKELKNIVKPKEVLLVLPADIGHIARKQAEEFNKLVGITGIIITKLDSTAKAGGALAAASVSGAKVKFIGIGEKIEDFERYEPERFVGMLIGYGDIKGLLEKAKEQGIERTAKNIMEGKFTFLEFYEQIKAIQGMGPLTRVMQMFPRLPKLNIPSELIDLQEEKMKRWRYAIDSMTKMERENPEILDSSRIKRIAKGSGVKEEEIKELIKTYRQIKKFLKMMKGGKALKRGPFASLLKQFGFGF
ncbi:MAG: signal recognition particle protein [Candidatus Aenigmatarchaeota archaeon]|nr:MAG: signal recognition particle protein [Candidatus Aenigmarchaeota archaeon]